MFVLQLRLNPPVHVVLSRSKLSHSPKPVSRECGRPAPSKRKRMQDAVLHNTRSPRPAYPLLVVSLSFLYGTRKLLFYADNLQSGPIARRQDQCHIIGSNT
ncbi:hypothetical protein T440DRAFT_481567 [Plenodomus tracheiphilus IPT5]|uniref:Uncharacterized protein n=1 Tax=Plenodomus tracheiphilus IPT5 TaxID=1408161 RepID=A0A6A7AWB3_9PLEO|nr:hypothetical protein T440DRAFT_481567 [Plenodomus tracheiphilus IPT5]